MKLEDFWYVVALSKRLKPHQVIARSVLGEWLAIFRGPDGQAVALPDRCMHRNSRLSTGAVRQGQLHCPYHGWVYDAQGQVVDVPSEGEFFQRYLKQQQTRCVKRYDVREHDGYVYVRLNSMPTESVAPFVMPHYGEAGWETVRVINRFANTVTNCAENFIDIPHTVSVHPGVFRSPRRQQLEMQVDRVNGSVVATYAQETDNLGWYRAFLNPDGKEIRHIDRYFMPNVTSVEYDLGHHRQCFITSQSVPETENSTLVYTDVTYNYGLWNKLARPFVWWTAQHIIGQDVAILKVQGETITKYGEQFSNTPADTIHVFVESIWRALERGEDPRLLPEKSVHIKFWV
ncbi:aromatic ring-hydroxylating dioxygenase subunit alpha [filamentous cyanobacterium LEGE 11480]|uniref:Aromatic ring-hydroxylating dioxygenase subunit alpha n=1 Tax=Romeriopsis navalis LEGE 11480 TaxID=2777977 RepID=A0A928Z344_9CYAN|nr:aromatic ring-hydroxylating dioxygenase subunit alpha [Romeriopsis navalis]MBE9029687.1 aromatic ring-hydroxylating dioxygenase subunit alpha [Romeriopsis navalis LEGE 11480]